MTHYDEKIKERQKIEAIKRMKMLGILPRAIKEFEEDGKVNCSECLGILYWLNEDEQQMVHRFEEKYNGVVYHVIKSKTDIGLLYSLLYVTVHEEEWEKDNNDIDRLEVCAYVVNHKNPWFSEFGYIAIRNSIGGLRRIH